MRAPAETGEAVYVVLTSYDVPRGVKAAVIACYRDELTLVEIAKTGTGARAAAVYRVQP